MNDRLSPPLFGLGAVSGWARCIVILGWCISNVAGLATAADLAGAESAGVETRPLQSGLEPQAAADNMTAEKGFRVTLAAGEPMVHQPVAMAFDDRGRLWVAEAYTYPIRAAEGEGRDKLIILEDTDHDGVFDSRKVFAEGLNLVSGLELGFGGVWVGAAPYLLFIPDRDHDDRPDSAPQILLDGFGYQDTHETLNAFIWGPDGWLYGCHGVFTHSRVGKPGTPDQERTPMNAAVWRYHPTRHEFEVFSWGTSNPWGVDFNDHGHAFITACVIPHLWHVIQGARYHRQGGQHFDRYFYEDIQTIAEHRHYAGRIEDHAWWGQEPDAPADTLAAGGGHAHCGAMIYLGDNWPASYRNEIFMHNIHGNRVNHDHLVRKGSGYTGQRAPDLLLANDRWFRGINLKCAPDGTVYLIDWYDRNACHRVNPEIWDRTNGRVYRVAYGERKPVSVQVSKMAADELVMLHLHANDWYVRMARRVLQEQAAAGQLKASAVADNLWKMATQHDDTTRRLRAIWTMHACGMLDEKRIQRLLKDQDENVRSWAIQLELEDRAATPATVQILAQMASSDSSALVRLYLASALQRLPLNDRWALVEGLATHAEDRLDQNLPLMIWYGTEPLVATDFPRALALAKRSAIPKLSQFIVRRASAETQGLELVVQALSTIDETPIQRAILEQIAAAFEGRVGIAMPAAWQAAYVHLQKSSNAEVMRRADEIAILLGDQRVFPKMRSLLTDARADLDRRRQALEILVRGQDRLAASAYHSALNEGALRGPALRALSSLDDPQTPQLLIEHYASWNEQDRRDAIGTLTARPEYALALLDAIEKKQIPNTDLHAFHVRQLQSFGNPVLDERVRTVWGEIRAASADKQAAMAKYKEVATQTDGPAPNPGNGRRIFASTCANCHRLFGEGGQVGPDITGSNRANLDYVLENVIDPSAVLGKDYRMTVLELADGRVVSGLIQQESDSAITIRTLNDTLLIAKADVDTRELSELSMMPEGLLDRLSPAEVRDLLAYLASPTQVAPRGPEAPIDAKTGKVPGALEGEALKIVEKTRGTAQNQGMQGFPGDRWSGNSQLWWTGGQDGDKLSLAVPSDQGGDRTLAIVLTQAPDYAMIQLRLDGQPLGGPVDCYAAQVLTTGVLEFPITGLKAGDHQLQIEILGANPHAVPSRMVGIDLVQWK